MVKTKLTVQHMTYNQKNQLQKIVESSIAYDDFWVYCECNPIDGNKPFRWRTLASLRKQGFIDLCVCGRGTMESNTTSDQQLGVDDVGDLDPCGVYWCRPTEKAKAKINRRK